MKYEKKSFVIVRIKFLKKAKIREEEEDSFQMSEEEEEKRRKKNEK